MPVRRHVAPSAAGSASAAASAGLTSAVAEEDPERRKSRGYETREHREHRPRVRVHVDATVLSKLPVNLLNRIAKVCLVAVGVYLVFIFLFSSQSSDVGGTEFSSHRAEVLIEADAVIESRVADEEPRVGQKSVIANEAPPRARTPTPTPSPSPPARQPVKADAVNVHAAQSESDQQRSAAAAADDDNDNGGGDAQPVAEVNPNALIGKGSGHRHGIVGEQWRPMQPGPIVRGRDAALGVWGVDSQHLHGVIGVDADTKSPVWTPLPPKDWSKETLAEKEKAHNHTCFNLRHSDSLPLDRPIPDTRDKQCAAKLDTPEYVLHMRLRLLRACVRACLRASKPAVVGC